MIRTLLLIIFMVASISSINADEDMLDFHDKNVEKMDKKLLEHFNSNAENGMTKENRTVRDFYSLWYAILLKIKQFWMLKDGGIEKMDEIKEIYTKVLQRLANKMQQSEPEIPKDNKQPKTTQIKEFAQLLFGSQNYVKFMPNLNTKNLWLRIVKIAQIGGNLVLRKVLVTELLELHYELGTLVDEEMVKRNQKKLQPESIIEYRALTKTIFYGTKVRGLKACDDFYKMVCAGAHKQFWPTMVDFGWFQGNHPEMVNTIMENKMKKLLDNRIQENTNGINYKMPKNEGEEALQNQSEAKCLKQMSIFYKKCTQVGNEHAADKIQDIKQLFDSGIFVDFVKKFEDLDKNGGRKSSLLNTQTFIGAFPFSPFFGLKRIKYGKGEKLELFAKDAIFMDIERRNEAKMSKMLKLLHENGLFGGETEKDLDALIQAVIEIDYQIDQSFLDDSSRTFTPLFGTQLLRYTPTIDWLKVANAVMPNLRIKHENLSLLSIVKPTTIGVAWKLLKDGLQSKNLLNRRAIVEYMNLSQYWWLLDEIGDNKVNEILEKEVSKKDKANNCVSTYLRGLFPHCLRHLLARHEHKSENHGPAQAVQPLFELFEQLRAAFVEFIQTSSAHWMSSWMREKAIAKIKAIKLNVGHTAEFMDGQLLDALYYGQLELRQEMSWPEMLVLAKRQSAQRPPNGAVGEHSDMVYSGLTNSINVSHAMLQEPYYFAEGGQPETNSPIYKILNFAGIGAKLAHEIAHSIDSAHIFSNSIKGKATFKSFVMGSMIALKSQNYDQKFECLKKQYAKYWVKNK